jgi:hypothetical protein
MLLLLLLLLLLRQAVATLLRCSLLPGPSRLLLLLLRQAVSLPRCRGRRCCHARAWRQHWA